MDCKTRERRCGKFNGKTQFSTLISQSYSERNLLLSSSSLPQLQEKMGKLAYSIDTHSIKLGTGEHVYKKAVLGLKQWQHINGISWFFDYIFFFPLKS